MIKQNDFLDIAPTVYHALMANQPIVALESTIIAHGMPYPQNVETALQVEAKVQAHGAIPATISILEGRLKVGMTESQIEQLAKLGQRVTKVSRRDLAYVISQGQNGATTVATTMLIAEMAGIRIFATGGIGGVHRGGHLSLDISADLQELAQTKVAVISAGAKAILDLGRTLEYLETFGVPVIGYQTDVFPAFYTRNSAFTTPFRMDDPTLIAQFLKTQRDLALKGGVLIANPIPQASELRYDYINKAVEQAIQEAEELQVTGKAITPFLLGKIVEITGGESLAANIDLVLNNAKLAAQVARALSATERL